MAWDKQWTVPSSDGKREYVVSLDTARGEWACSCKGWTTHVPRRDCKHIKQTLVWYGMRAERNAVRKLEKTVTCEQRSTKKNNRQEKEQQDSGLTEAPQRLIDLPDDD
jgi:hypothetical protein